MILHHYPASPFAEKIRAVLGFKQLDWQSVTIPSVMPKPDLMPLTGGYRKTPVMQIGADIYCDTSLICDVLEHLAPAPSLYNHAPKGLVRSLAQWADTLLFPVAMAYNFQPAGAAHVMASFTPETVKAFAADRQAMRGGGARMHHADATAMYKSLLRRISSMLEGQAFLLGDAPCLADFSVYHSLWFTQVQVPMLAGILDATPAVQAWVDRIAAMGHGQSTSISAEQALQAAKGATPLSVEGEFFQDEHGFELGSPVTVAAESFGTEPTPGELVAATRTRYVLRRHDERVGTVHVHFPRLGFVMKKATS